jgi:hypothetical protein
MRRKRLNIVRVIAPTKPARDKLLDIRRTVDAGVSAIAIPKKTKRKR